MLCETIVSLTIDDEVGICESLFSNLSDHQFVPKPNAVVIVRTCSSLLKLFTYLLPSLVTASHNPFSTDP